MAVLGMIASLLSGPAAADLRYEQETTSDGVGLIIVSGVFEPDDDLQDFALAVGRIHPRAVVFDSPGGQPQKAMELGRLIRALGLSTFQPYGPACVSACALAFLGGVERYADPGAIGVHKTYFDEGAPLDPAGAVSAIQELTADTLEYLSEMEVDPELLELAMRYESTDIRYLSGSEMAEFHVTTAEPRSDAAAAPAAQAEPVPEAYKERVSSQSAPRRGMADGPPGATSRWATVGGPLQPAQYPPAQGVLRLNGLRGFFRRHGNQRR